MQHGIGAKATEEKKTIRVESCYDEDGGSALRVNPELLDAFALLHTRDAPAQ